MFFVIDELGHIVAKRKLEAEAIELAQSYTDSPKIRGRFDVLSMSDFYSREQAFQKAQTDFQAKGINRTNQDSWGWSK